MRTLNFYGVSSCMVPTLNASLPFVEVGGEFANNNIYFFNGTIPSSEEIYEIQSESELLTTYADSLVSQFNGITLTYIQDNSKLQRTIKKKPDVLDLEYAIDATIGWFAIVLSETSPETGFNPIIFSDSIGLDETELKFVTLESVTGVTGDTNLLREISMILTEVSDLEA